MSYKQVVTVTPGVTANVSLQSVQNIQAVKVTNGTPFDLDYTGVGAASIVVIPAGLEYMFYADQERSGNISILPVNNNNITGTGVVNITIFLIGDQIPKGTWPATVPTQTVQAKVSTVTTLVNDGSAVGTQIIESTPAGAASSTISILNDGTVTIKGDVAAVLTALLQLIPGAAAGASSVKLADSTRTTEILGKLLVDGTFESVGAATHDSTSTFTGDATFNGAGSSITTANDAVVGGSLKTNTIRDNVVGNDQIDLASAGVTFNKLATFAAALILGTGVNDFIESGDNSTKIVDCTSGTNMFFNPPGTGAGRIIGFATNATDRMEVGDGGLTLKNGSTITLLAGSVSRMTGSNNTAAGSNTVITHGLGATPNYVTCCEVATQPASATVGVGAIGSTTFACTIGAGAAVTWSTKL